MSDNLAKIRIIGTSVSIVAIAVGLISWASATGIKANQNEAAIQKLNESLAYETECRIEEDAKLKDSINTQAAQTQKSLTEIQVKLTNIDTKLDTNLTYLVKAFDKQQEE